LSSALKLVLVGESGVGKTSFVNILQNKNLEGIKSTIDVEFHTVILNYKNKPLKLSVFDFGGKPQYRFMQTSHLKGVYGIILMFDLSNESSFKKLNEWVRFLQPVTMGYTNFPTILIGNKSDLNDIKVKEEDINAFLKANNIAHYEKISSKEREKIERPFQQLILTIMKFYLDFQKKAQDAKEKIEILLKEAEKTKTNEILEEIKKEETKIDIITPVRHVIEDMASLNLKEVRKDLIDLRKNIRRTFQIVFNPPPRKRKPVRKSEPKFVKKEEKKEKVKRVTTFKVLKADSLREGMKVYVEKSIED